MISIYNFIYELENCFGSSDMPAILIGIITAYLTLMITIAVALFSDRHHEFETLDRFVIIDNIVRAKSLFISLCMFFVSLLLWNLPFFSVRLISAVFFCISIVLLFKILVRSYNWMKRNRHGLRVEYLGNICDDEDLEEVWRSVWQSEKINPQNEREFMDLYFSVIDKLLGRRR